jgi:hypothetical protein
MVVYVEYAFLENFFFDGALLCLALVASKAPFKRWRIVFAAACGSFFAILYPLLTLPTVAAFLLKTAFGFLLCMTAYGRIKNKKEWGRYALSAILFFGLTFAFGGALSALQTAFNLSSLPQLVIVVGFCVCCFIASFLLAKLYQKRRLHSYIYPCKVFSNGKGKELKGYFDSGNLASKNALPVCFLSPDIFYEFFGGKILFCEGQVRDEMQIVTMSGGKKIPLFKGELEIKTEQKIHKKQVYFALGGNMIDREYQILLNARIFET